MFKTTVWDYVSYLCSGTKIVYIGRIFSVLLWVVQYSEFLGSSIGSIILDHLEQF